MTKKRSVRRHHEERVKRKSRNVAEQWAGSPDSFSRRWVWEYDDEGKLLSSRLIIDTLNGGVKREKWIEKTASRLAHHNKCPCNMCKRPRYTRKRVKIEEE